MKKSGIVFVLVSLFLSAAAMLLRKLELLTVLDAGGLAVFKPVTAITVIPRDGSPAALFHMNASAALAFLTRTEGIPLSPGLSVTMTAAPRRAASAANSFPSYRVPRRATKA